MRYTLLPATLLFSAMAVLPPGASASVANFASTNQTVTFTGLGANASGNGQFRVSWGTCVFAIGTTTCNVTAPYTGVGVGGIMTMTVAYPGNGPSPLTAVTNSPGSILVTFGLSAGTAQITLSPTNGSPATFYQPGILVNFNNAS